MITFQGIVNSSWKMISITVECDEELKTLDKYFCQFWWHYILPTAPAGWTAMTYRIEKASLLRLFFHSSLYSSFTSSLGRRRVLSNVRVFKASPVACTNTCWFVSRGFLGANTLCLKGGIYHNLHVMLQDNPGIPPISCACENLHQAGIRPTRRVRQLTLILLITAIVVLNSFY